MKIWLLYALCFNLILGLEVKNSPNALLFERSEEHARDIAKTLIGASNSPQDAPIRTVRGYKSKLAKQKKREEAEAAAKAAAEAAEKARQEAEARAKGKGNKEKTVIKDKDDKVWISKAAENADINAIKARISSIIKEANQWIQNNIGRHARRLVERYNALPDRYMQVIGRCRDPNTLDDLDELRKSRPIRQENKEKVQQERAVRRLEKKEEKEEKIRMREEKAQAKTEDSEAEVSRKRRQSGSGSNGQRFRPNRIEKKPLKYYQYLYAQIRQRKLQRNELKCDAELHPECKKKGKPGQVARKKFRPDPREAMWTKINRAIRLAALEVRNECHIWDKVEKKTAKLKKKAWRFWMKNDDGSQRTNAAKISVVKDTLAKFLESD